MPDAFGFCDLRHTGHTLSTRSGATLKDTMVRPGLVARGLNNAETADTPGPLTP